MECYLLLPLRGMDNFSGEITIKMVCLPSEKGSALIEKESVPFGDKCFPFRVDPISEGDPVQKCLRKVTKIVSLVKSDKKKKPPECTKSSQESSRSLNVDSYLDDRDN